MGSRTLPVFALALLVALPLSAQEPGEVQLFGEDETEIKIKAATKTDIPISKAPGSVTVITHEQIKASGARTIPELVRLVAGLNIRWNPMVQTIDIRGFGSNPFSSRVLLMIDGVPFNAGDKGGFPQHPGLDFFVLQNVKRLEVVRGPGSALYGENAYWGVLNVVTLSGNDIRGAEVEIFGGDRSTGSVGATVGQKLGEDGSIFVSAKYLQSQFPMVFWAEEQDSKVDGTDVFLKAKYKGLQMSYYRHEDTVDGFSETFAPEDGFPPGSAFTSAETLQQTVDIVAAKYDYARNEKWSLGGDFSFMRRNGSHCGGCHAAQQDEEFLEPADHGGQVIGDFRVGLHALSGHDFLLGIETRHVTTGDHSHELGLPPHAHAPGTPADHDHDHETEVVPETYTKAAFYVQDQMSFVDDRARVTAGFRYDGKSNLFDDTFSPRIAGVFDVARGLVLRAGWSTAFRFPNFSERYQDSWFFTISSPFGAFPAAVFSPNPDINPEEIQTAELGAEYRFSSSASVKFDFHRSRLTDFIVLTYGLLPPPDPAFARFENHPDEATIWGTELEFRYRAANGFTAFANWSHQSQDQVSDLRDSVGNLMEFSYAPGNKFNVGGYFGRFDGLGGNFEYAWRDTYTGPSFWYLVASGFQDPTVTPLPSYGLLNTRINYDLPFGWNGHDRPWQLSFYGKNLLDEQPRETLIGVDSRLVGREFFFGTTFRF